MENHEEKDKTISWEAILLIMGISMFAVGGWQMLNDRFNKALDQLIPGWKLPIAAQCDRVNEQFEQRTVANPVIDKQLIWSDMHLGIGDASDDSLFDGATRSFIGRQTDRHGVELILAGDILELAELLAKKPLDPAILEKIKSAHPDFFWSLWQFLSNGGRLVYIVGNHDMPMVLPAFQKAFLEQVYGDQLHFLIDFPESAERIKFVAGEYVSNATLVLHGQQQDPVNSVKRAGVHSKDGSCWFDESEGIKVVASIRSLEECAPWIDNAKFVDSSFSSDESLESLKEKLETVKVLIGDIWSSGCLDEIENATSGWVGKCHNMIFGYNPLIRGPGVIDVWNTCNTAVKRIRSLNAHSRASDAIVNYARSELSDSDLRVVVAGHTHDTDKVELSEGKWYFNTGSWTPRTYGVTTWTRAAKDWQILQESPKEALRPSAEMKIVYSSLLPFVRVAYTETPPLNNGKRCEGECRKIFSGVEFFSYDQLYLKILEPEKNADKSGNEWEFWAWIIAGVIVDLLLRTKNNWYRRAIPHVQGANQRLATHICAEFTARVPEYTPLLPLVGPLLDVLINRERYNEALQEYNRLKELHIGLHKQMNSPAEDLP